MRKLLIAVVMLGSLVVGSTVTGHGPGVALASDQFTASCGPYYYSGGSNPVYLQVYWTVNYPNTVLSIDSATPTYPAVKTGEYDYGVGTSTASASVTWNAYGYSDEHTMWVSGNGTYACG